MGEPISAGATVDEVRATDGLLRRQLLGLDFVDAASLDPVLAAVLARHEMEGAEVLPVLVTPNVDIMVQLGPSLGSVEGRLMRRAGFVLPDGMPIVVASRLLGTPLSARLTGSGLFELLWPALVAQDRSVMVLCANPTIARRLEVGAPSARFLIAPVIDRHDNAALDQLVGDLLELAADQAPEFLLLGIGHPKDPIIASRFLERWPAALGRPPLVCCLGGSFALYIGLQRRAPAWMQEAGLEWFYRFVQEPRRLFRRYFVRDVAFVGIVGRALLAQRRGRSRS
jgi:N-acetylglucosaminyldiphosphoundecaprenol N-acetyl-beta-D-mannosaminyltransferase